MESDKCYIHIIVAKPFVRRFILRAGYTNGGIFRFECALVAFKGINAYSEGIFIVIPAPEPVLPQDITVLSVSPYLPPDSLKNFSLQGMATLVVRASSKLGSSYASSIMTVCSSGAETPKVSALFPPLPISFAFLIAKRREANGAAVAGVSAAR